MTSLQRLNWKSFFFAKPLITTFKLNHLWKIWNAKHAKYFLTLQRVSWLNLSLLSKRTQTNTLTNFIGLQQANYFLKPKTFTMPHYFASRNWKLWILHTEMEECSAQSVSMHCNLCLTPQWKNRNCGAEEKRYCWTSDRRKDLASEQQKKVPIHFRIWRLTPYLHCIPYQDMFLNLQGDYAFSFPMCVLI